MIDNDRLGFLIGDVSGKGIPAAIFMAVSRTLIRATGLNGMAPNKCLQYVNDLLCYESVSCMFVTVFYGIMNMKTGDLEYANAGHNPPYILRNDNTIQKLEISEDIILGCFENYEFTSRNIRLNPNDGILLFTDGVTEAFNQDESVYGKERLEQLLLNSDRINANSIVNVVVDDVNNFAQSVPQSDDITLLSLKYYG